MDDPDMDSELQPLIQRAVQNRIHVFVWFADLDAFRQRPARRLSASWLTRRAALSIFHPGKIFLTLNLLSRPCENYIR